jgi:hypothetical protein
MEMCARPGAVTDDDLVAYAYDEAPPEVVQHVQSCPACARSADEHRRFQAQISALLYRVDCPSSHMLGEYHLDVLTPGERRQIAAHVAECPACADEVRTLSRFLVSEPPAEPAGVIEQVKRIIATLLPLTPEAAYAAVRSTRGPSAQKYQAEDLFVTIHLQATARQSLVNITGEIWRENGDEATFAGRIVRLIAPDGGVTTASIGDRGEFLVDAVARGSYRLEIDLSDRIVVIEALRVDN